MREHPIPQDIVGYRFHIIGSMTLRQFAELAVGAILGLIIYATNLPAAIKWPLIFVAGALGAAAAFLPIEERPLDHWISTFFKVLYQPTKFFWKRSSKIPEIFTFEVGKEIMEKKDEIDLTPIRRQRIKEYLASVRAGDNFIQDEYDQIRNSRLQEIMTTFNEVVPEEITVKKQIEKPILKIRTRALKKRASQNTPGLESDSTTQETVVYRQEKNSNSQTQMKELDNPTLAANQIAQQVEIPTAKTTQIETKEIDPSQEVITTTLGRGAKEGIDINTTNISSSKKDRRTNTNQNRDQVAFNAALPFPSPPTQPNKIVGMILTSKNELIPEAIVEIKNEDNQIVRAVKSNALGQFFISTPLGAGNYDLTVKHNKYKFNPQVIHLENEIVEPIEIRSLQ